MAVLEKRSGVQLSSCDAYVNITGGIKIQEPAIDLGIVLAILSSFRNKALNPKLVAFGEVGLSEECVVPLVSLEECKKEVRSGSLASVLYRMLWIKCLADGLELWKCIWK